MAKLSYLEAIRQAQDLALQQNKDVFILGEDVGRKEIGRASCRERVCLYV